MQIIGSVCVLLLPFTFKAVIEQFSLFCMLKFFVSWHYIQTKLFCRWIYEFQLLNTNLFAYFLYRLQKKSVLIRCWHSIMLPLFLFARCIFVQYLFEYQIFFRTQKSKNWLSGSRFSSRLCNIMRYQIILIQRFCLDFVPNLVQVLPKLLEIRVKIIKTT